MSVWQCTNCHNLFAWNAVMSCPSCGGSGQFWNGGSPTTSTAVVTTIAAADPTPARLTKEELDYAEVCLTELGEAAGLRPRLVFAELRAHRAAESAQAVTHGAPCGFCGERCNNLAANPNRWAVAVPDITNPGTLKQSCYGCLATLYVIESACRPYLREGETASEGLARLTEDAASSTRIGKGAATLYAQEMQRAERLAAELRQAEAALQQAQARATDLADQIVDHELAAHTLRERIVELEQERNALKSMSWPGEAEVATLRQDLIEAKADCDEMEREANDYHRMYDEEVVKVAALEDAQRWRPIGEHDGSEMTASVSWEGHDVFGVGDFDQRLLGWRDNRDGSVYKPQPTHFAALPPGPTREGQS